MRWTPIILIFWLLSAPLFAADPPKPKEASSEVSPEDLEIIVMIETLEIMEMMDVLDMVIDMDILLEENDNENQD